MARKRLIHNMKRFKKKNRKIYNIKKPCIYIYIKRTCKVETEL